LRRRQRHLLALAAFRFLRHRFRLPEEILTHHQRRFPSLAGAVLSNDGVRSLELAVRWAIEAGCMAGMGKLLRWGFADWANEGHGYAN
jgi:hypothetical protein